MLLNEEMKETNGPRIAKPWHYLIYGLNNPFAWRSQWKKIASKSWVVKVIFRMNQFHIVHEKNDEFLPRICLIDHFLMNNSSLVHTKNHWRDWQFWREIFLLGAKIPRKNPLWRSWQKRSLKDIIDSQCPSHYGGLPKKLFCSYLKSSFESLFLFFRASFSHDLTPGLDRLRICRVTSHSDFCTSRRKLC